MKILRQYRKLLGWFMTCLMAVWLPGQSLQAATFYWDSGADGDSAVGGTGNWNTTSTFWSATSTDATGSDNLAWNNAGIDLAVFGGTAGAVTLTEAITAGGLTFNTTGFTVTGDVLTLDAANSGAAPAITVGNGNFLTNTGLRTVISSTLAGTEGLMKAGNGTLVLTADNSYTGATIARNGVLSISNQNQLGDSAGTVGVVGVNAAGFLGGALQLQGGTVNAAGQTFSRDLSLSGRGNNAMGSGSLMSIGNNTFTGDIVTSSATETRVTAAGGTTTLNGRLVLGAAAQTYFYGPGNFVINGQIVGGGAANQSNIVKASSGLTTTLTLGDTFSNTLLGGIRAEGGFVRVSNGAQLGLLNNTGESDSGNLNFNGGTFEIRTNNTASFATRNLSYEFGNGTVFVDRAIGQLGATGLNQIFTFANLRQENNRTDIAFTGRNGNNITIAALNNNGNGNNAEGFRNSGNGLVTFTGNIWGEGNNHQTLTMTATGEMVLTGNITASATTNQAAFTKAGTGTFTIQGTASTFNGNASVNAGTLNISTIGAINSSGVSRVVLGGGHVELHRRCGNLDQQDCAPQCRELHHHEQWHWCADHSGQHGEQRDGSQDVVPRRLQRWCCSGHYC